MKQLAALLALRWRMVRSPVKRIGLAALATLVPLGIGIGAVTGRAARVTPNLRVAVLLPTIMLGFAVLSVLAPLVAGGGNELYPADQLVAYPVRPDTQFLAGFAVLPINLAWVTQLVLLVGAASYALPPARWNPVAAVPFAAYVGFVVAFGQLAVWLVAGLRQTRAGRAGLRTLAIVGGLALVALVETGVGGRVLDRSPTVRVVGAMLLAGRGDVGWVAPTAVLVALTAAAVALGRRTCRWALRQPGDAGAHPESRAVRRRPPARRTSQLQALVRTDRASVWRTPTLRRGALTLALLPGGVAALTEVSWEAVTLLPGLVAAGAGLLFGVNMFCLDGGGALWLGSLPHDPAIAIRAKTRVVAEICLACALPTVLVAAVRAGGPPRAAALTAAACATIVTTLSVVSTCLHLSTTRPHRADLRGRRDTPAPPGAMAVYSVRLAVTTTPIGLLLSGTGATPWWWVPPLVALPLAAASLHSITRAWRSWADPAVRGRVAVTVAAG